LRALDMIKKIIATALLSGLITTIPPGEAEVKKF
jgi:hypothetical protein